MTIDKLARYRQYIHLSIWIFIAGATLLVNFILIPTFSGQRPLINLLLGIIASYTLVYYQIVAPRIKNPSFILISFTIYTFFIFVLIHLTGSFESIFFPTLLAPILVSAVMLGVTALFYTTVLILIFLLTEIFIFSSLVNISNNLLLFREMGTVTIIFLLSFFVAKEIEERMKEHETLEKQKDRGEVLHRKLLQDRDKIRAVFNSIDKGVLAADKNSRIILLNPAAENITGFTKKELLEKHLDDVIKLYEQNKRLKSTKYCSFSENLSAPIMKRSLLIKGKGNVEKYVDLTAAPTDKEIGGCIIILTDVTEERELEHLRLDFVSMAAHELRSPITSIRGYLSLLGKELGSSINNEQEKYLKRTEISCDQLTTLIDNILSVSQIEKRALNFSRSETTWEETLNEAVKPFFDQAEEKGIKLSLKTPPKPLPHVNVDKFRIKEVIANLLSNAINFTTRGGSVEVSTYQDKNMVMTSIKDTGQGMPKEAMAQLFTKFFRISSSLEHGAKGTGLGLYISKALVEKHGGRVWAESELGKGSTFYFTVPIYKK